MRYYTRIFKRHWLQEISLKFLIVQRELINKREVGKILLPKKRTLESVVMSIDWTIQVQKGNGEELIYKWSCRCMKETQQKCS